MNKKAQEEMVGFIVIIVLVSIIFLIFLVISLRKEEVVGSSLEVNSFLNALMLGSVDCTDSGNKIDFKELVINCYSSRECDEGESCAILKTNALENIEKSWKRGSKMKNGWKFSIFVSNTSLIREERGNLSSERMASEVNIPIENENIIVRLEIS